ncbi:right-handed parallel beta-helix repeat-containing protein [Candidatus Bathyarchaeota archaeon]|nr:right-handed parallel beta-helix repeat-containing protein [Candidatus Bathyarchaeota archaeon]
MSRRTVSAVIIAMLLAGILTAAFNVQPVRASATIYIRADGSIDPPTAPIYTADNITYTLTGNVITASDGIVIERDNTFLIGAGYTVQGSEGHGYGITLSGRTNVTIQSTAIIVFRCCLKLDHSSNNSIAGNNIAGYNMGSPAGSGIWLGLSSGNSINGNNIATNHAGMLFVSSSNNSIVGNTITNNDMGIRFHPYSDNNSVSGNNITASNYGGYGIVLSGSNNSVSGNSFVNCGLDVSGYYGNVVTGNLVNGKPLVYLEGVSDYAVGDAGQVVLVRCNKVTVENLNLSSATVGVELWETNNTAISGNNITANYAGGINLYSSSNNSVSGNNITANYHNGIVLLSSSNNTIYHNNFINNVPYSPDSTNVWDDGYPSGGNYWSVYTGLDQKCGPSQDHPGSDGMGDTPYVIDSSNQDNYPLMNPWTPPAGHNVAVVSVVSSKTVVCQGFSGNVTVYAANRGEYSETFNVTLSAQNQTAVNQTGLVGCWKFDEGAGTTAYDSSGNGNNGTLVNGPTWAAGKYGEALSFDGVNDYVEIAGNTDLNPYTSDWTVSAWVNLNKLCPYIYGQPYIYGFVILGKRQSEFDNSLTLLVHSGTNATSQARFGFIWDGSMQAAGAQSDLMNVFGWHHVVGVRRGGELYVYVDGVEYGPNNYLYAGNNITSATSISSATPVRLAYHGSWFFYNGTIDEVRIYDRALSAGEILAQYEGVIFAIQTRTVTLAGSSSATLAFVWNTTGVPYGNYTLSACAWPVQGETDTADNNFTGGWVVVSPIGDITGPDSYPDGKVDVRDVATVAKLFGVNYPDTRFNPNCDINNDLKIDVMDVASVARHFGDHYP